MRVAFRVDASSTMGTGHLKRCLSLAEALQEQGAEVLWVVRPLDGVAARLLAATTWPVCWLPPPSASAEIPEGSDAPPCAAWAQVAWPQDASDTAQALAGGAPDWLVVDHYALDARWHGAVRTALGCRLLVIDDTADRPLDADVLLDQNWHADHRAKYACRLLREPLWLAGPRFALLAPAYRTAPRHRFRAKVESIGIFMGGTDPGGASAKALHSCRASGFQGPVEVVSTSANPGLNALRAACESDPRATLTLDLPDLAAFFARHDLQIGAGGGATWERCCMGVPSIGVVLADNQTVVVPALDQMGTLCAARLDEAAAPDDLPTLSNALARLLNDTAARQSLGEHAAALVDGRGAQRVALRLLGDRLRLRPATMADATRLHDWRNHPATRTVSGNAEAIDFSAHQVWLQRVIDADNRCLWVAQVGALPVGSIRFDRADNRDWEVSLYLDPDLLSLGLGPHLLLAGEQALRGQIQAGGQLVAQVLPGNTASQRLFEACGYDGGPQRYLKAIAPLPTPFDNTP